MILDYDFTLLFRPSARDEVIESLKGLCESESVQRLETAKGGTGDAEVDLTLRALADMPAEIVAAYPPLPDGTGSLGYIYLYISPSTYSEFPNALDFRLWPCTRRLQRACFGSMLLRDKLQELLTRHGGYVGYIVYESSIPVKFWHHSTGRANDDHPPEYVTVD